MPSIKLQTPKETLKYPKRTFVLEFRYLVGIWFRLLWNSTDNCYFRCTLYLSLSLPLSFLYLSIQAAPSAWKTHPLLIYLHELHLILHISAQLSLFFRKAHFILFLRDCFFFIEPTTLCNYIFIHVFADSSKLPGPGTSSFMFPIQSPESCKHSSKGMVFHK